MPCGCLADSIVSLDKAGQDKFFIPLMSSPWQAPQAPTRWCKACCKPQSKYTPWPVSCFSRCITSRLLHHILATASRLASHIPPRFPHRTPCLASCIAHCTSFPHRASHLIPASRVAPHSRIARRASFPASHVTPCFPHRASHVAPCFPHRTSPPASRLASLYCYSPIMQFINSSCI